eukprot:CAMPEP_0180096040 /NCGR_PEP_ID=MMETSP0985-20121206/26469_1 /TAXON_ID=483367 /ORGANISM="non described non described, Strain CCMP 2436" /LENGTH=124 /DNA_ID=CAMNT_0022031315 /DNA_START=141 /DNA_END=515 /DNA_ORIENTATION=+
MSTRQCHSTAVFDVQQATVLVRVSKYRYVPILGSIRAGVAVPRAAVLVRVPKHLNVPSLGSTGTDPCAPRATARVEPSQRGQVPLPSSSTARPRCGRALPAVDQLLEHAHAADGRGEGYHAHPL